MAPGVKTPDPSAAVTISPPASSSGEVEALKSAGLLLPRTNVRRLLLLVLLSAALISLSVGIDEAVHHSIDFEWSGARLVANHQDPYKTFLEGDPHHQFVLGQQPDYLPELFALYLPLGLMRFPTAEIIWAAINTCFAISCVWIVGRTFHLKDESCVILMLTFLSMAIIAWFWFGSSLVSHAVVWPSIPVLAFNCMALSLLAGTFALAYSTEPGSSEFDALGPE